MADSDAGVSGGRTRSEDAADPPRGETPPGADSALTDVTALASLIFESVRDAARLLGLETRLVITTLVMLVALAVVLGILVIGVWLSLTVVIAVGLYEYTGMGLTTSVALASLLNVAGVGAGLVILRKLIRRLAYPETRLALRTLLQQASKGLKQQE